MSQVGQEIGAFPFEDLIKNIAMGIAKAQVALDESSAQVALMMSGANEEDKIDFNGERVSLFELGMRPTFYQFVDTVIEIKIVVSMTTSTSSEHSSSYSKRTAKAKAKLSFWSASASAEATVTTSTVNAKYAKKYDYSVEGSSLVRTKLVPVPPPAILEERIRLIMEQDAKAKAETQP
ncbi:MAG: hypothetical protein KDD02_26195 [Phaeodactylibacter sp.]|nr:hypothetical protein [Phaeodactylibacter sp.]MCB9299230.1 hypothetical protein [Lewinellaceae bacterium]